MSESRSSQSLANLQEILDAGQVGDTSLEQYLTPHNLAYELASRLPNRHPASVFDPQVGGGALVNCTHGYPTKFGIELDYSRKPGGVHVITGNCMKTFEAIEELMPELRFVMANANPPFGKSWKMANGKMIDSTLATWRFVTAHANCGFLIANCNTIEKLGIHLSTDKIDVFFYEQRQALLYWTGLRPELKIGVLCWKRKDEHTFTPPSMIVPFWETMRKIAEEEAVTRPKFNIFLDHAGFIKTYLSQRTTFKMKLTKEQILKLHRLNGAHPLSLTTEKETRDLMRQLVDCGLYTIEPAAKESIERALAEVNALACPIMPISSFEHVAYSDEEDVLMCIKSHAAEINGAYVELTAGKSYPLRTGVYKFTEEFKRRKAHYNEQTEQTYTVNHNCILSGSDRYIAIHDDNNRELKFMDRPRKENKYELLESLLWDFFKKPTVNTVAETCREAVNTNHAVLKACEMLAGYTYYAGQLDYLSRLAVKDCALVAGETGAGKTLLAISLLAMKSPERALIIAPQGTMRASKVDDDDDDDSTVEEMSASQWVKEINKFAPYIQVFEIFSYEDYQRILNMNEGKLPYGVYLTYFEAFFSNGAREKAPATWNDEKLNQWAKLNELAEIELAKDSMGALDKHYHCDSIGKEVNGVRCILQPCLSTLIGDKFDAVIVDEAHKCKNQNAGLTEMLIRLQPRIRYCLTATPVSNDVLDLFALMGWLAVPDWYKGNLRNAAWPYAREDIGQFAATFKTQERDLTQEDHNRAADPKNKSKCIKDSPIISSPARLLKLLKPNLAFISKVQCRADYIPPKIIDVRVKMGQAQSKLYGHFTNRANINATSAYIRAGKQVQYLRNICADPAGFTHGGPKVMSNMNPKVIAILELTRDILGRGEQVVIINSRVGLTNTIEEKLHECGVSTARIDSTISAEQHAYQSNIFKSGKARIMFMGIKSAASYSFDACENLIIGSLEYAFGPYSQSVGRIDRITNKVVKNIYCILHQDSIEEVQWEIVSLKGDASSLCLRGQRIPREFRPVDGSEILAKALDRFNLNAGTPEAECEQQWPKLRNNIKASLTNAKLNVTLNLVSH